MQNRPTGRIFAHPCDLFVQARPTNRLTPMSHLFCHNTRIHRKDSKIDPQKTLTTRHYTTPVTRYATHTHAHPAPEENNAATF